MSSNKLLKTWLYGLVPYAYPEWKKTSPEEAAEVAPIPGPRADDGFVVVGPSPGGLYPNVPGMGGSYPHPRRQAAAAPLRKENSIDSFHYLQGVPFSLSRELQLASNKDSFAIEIGDLLAFTANRINIGNYNYDFGIEKSVLKEC